MFAMNVSTNAAACLYILCVFIYIYNCCILLSGWHRCTIHRFQYDRL